jgi:two-component system, NarL family, nitrate/nitrite response regulator NarL
VTAAPKDRRGRNAPPRALVAAENAPLRAGVRLALERDGFVVCAEESSGPAAVAAAVRERADVCLLDVGLPGGGIAAAAEIVARRPEAVVVMLADSPEADEVFEALRAGARGYLVKDIDAERLPVAVRAVVEGEVALPRALVGLVVELLRQSGAAPAGPGLRTPEQLTSREWQVLLCLREGLSTSEIGRRLFIADVTVRRHVGRILRKLDVSSRAEAVRLAGGPL